MRKRLIEFISEVQYMGGLEEKLADHLLAKGVIVPPCKVGDAVYFPQETDGECEPYVDVGEVFAIGIDERYTMWISARYESGLKYYHTSAEFGKTVFLTRVEAERALKGGAE